MTVSANPERGEVLIRLGGQVHRLRPTFAAIVEVRKETGVPLGVSWARIKNMDVVEAAILIAATMRANGHKVTNEEVGEKLMAGGIAAAIEEVSTLILYMLTGGVEAGALGEATAAEGMERSPSAAGSATQS